MNDPRLQALLDQLDTILLLLDRPAVQAQFLAFGVIFLLSWLTPAPLGGILAGLIDKHTAISRQRQERGLPASRWRTRFLRYARGLQLLLFPVVGLVFSQLTIGYFESHVWPSGLLQRLAALFWLILGYRAAGGLLLAILQPEVATRYQKRFLRPVFIILIGVVATTGLAGAFPIFDLTLFSVMETPLTLRTLATAVVVIYLAFAVSWVVDDVFRRWVLPRTDAGPAVGNTIQIITRYAILAIGALTAISILGFDLSALAIIGGGLSVGIGFGLQELVANFISGILLLFEQTLRPGDIIEVGGQRGVVSQLRMRATVLRTPDNVDVYVPNKTLLTSTVSTYTNIDRVVRRAFNVSVSYKCDPVEVRDVLIALIESHGLVLKEPAPTVFFTGFGESGMNFEVGVWVSDPVRITQVVSDLHFMIFREFARHKIEMPYPQRDVHLRLADGLSPDRLQAVGDTANGASRPADAPPASKGGEHPDRVKAPTEKPNLPG